MIGKLWLNGALNRRVDSTVLRARDLTCSGRPVLDSHAKGLSMVDREHFLRVAKLTAGVALLPVGVAMLVLPGPGIPVVLGSLALLKDEFAWAKRGHGSMTLWAQRGRDWLENAATR
jgi:Putative transmembrane protein (PGPGW)